MTTHPIRRLGSSFLSLAAFLFAAFAQAGTLTVTDATDNVASPAAGSLRKTIADANPGDTIQFAANVTGTITLGGAELVIDKDLTLTGPGAAVLALSANQQSRVFRINSGVTANLSGLTIRDGKAPNGTNAPDPGSAPSAQSGGNGEGGGGLFNDTNATLFVTDCLFTNNRAGTGGIGAVTLGGIASNSGAGGSGGAIFSAGYLQVSGCTFSGNAAGAGGLGAHIFVFSGQGQTVAGAGGNGGLGGAIYQTASAQLTVDASVFTQNFGGAGGKGGGDQTMARGGDGGTGGLGGAIANTSIHPQAFAITTSIFSSNGGGVGGSLGAFGTVPGLAGDGGSGGALVTTAGAGTITGCTLSLNRGGTSGLPVPANASNYERSMPRGGSGGAVVVLGSGALVVTNSTVSGNAAGDGAAYNGPPFNGARAGYGGDGGGFFSSGALTLVSCTVSRNAAGQMLGLSLSPVDNPRNGYGGGLYGTSSSVSLRNTIVADNLVFEGLVLAASGLGPDLYSSVTTLGHNLVGKIDGSTGLTDGTNGDHAGSIAAPLTAGVASLGNFGGPTPTQALLSGSPAIDAGDDTLTGIDQRGSPRLVNGHVDIGAVEADLASFIVFDVAGSSTLETAGTANILVDRVGIGAAGETVNYATASGTATSSTDFLARSGTLTFAAGEGQKTITVPIVNDTAVESDETFTVTLSAPVGAALGSQTVQTVTILSEDITFQFLQAASTVNENAGPAVITVVRLGDTSASKSVTYSTSSGTATSGADFDATSGTLTFTAGQTQKTISVPIINDTAEEPDETFTVTLTGSAAGTALGTPVTHTVTIHSEDVVLHGTIAFAQAGSTATELDGVRIITIVRTGHFPAGETVQYTTVSGSAVAGSDFTTTSGTLTFGSADNQKTIAIPILNDALVEADETFTVTLSTPGGGAMIGALNSHTVTLFSDDVPNPNTFAFAAATSTVSETAGHVDVVVTRTGGDTSISQTVQYTMSHGTADGFDYTPVSGVLTFASGETQKTLSIAILNDFMVENDETFFVNLANPSGGGVLAGPSHTVTIVDDDGASHGLITFATDTSPVHETAGNASITVVRTGATPAGETAQYTTNQGSATAGSDYTTTSGTLTFAAGETQKTISVPILNDALVEAGEIFTVTLSTPGGGATLGALTTHTVTIESEDVAPHGTIAFAAAASNIGEANGITFILVTRTGATSAGETVQYATSNGSATAGSDYTTTSGTLTFAAGETQKTISVPILNDALVESDEGFSITLSVPGGGAVLGAQAIHGVTIVSDDVASHGTIAFATTVSNVGETAGPASITVVRTGGTPAGEMVHYTTTDGTASEFVDYTPTAGVLIFGAGETQKTISVPIVDNAFPEISETFTVTLSAPGGGAALGASTTHTVTIQDNDVIMLATVGFSHSDVSVSETAGHVDVEVVRGGSLGNQVTVQYTTTAGTATAGSDYSTASGLLTFLPNETQKIIQIPITDDVLSEGSEDFTVTLFGNSGGLLLTSTHTVTILDNEPAPGIFFAAAASTVAESDGHVEVTILRNGSPAVQTVHYHTVAGTAAAGKDFTTTNGLVTFGPNDPQKTITVPIAYDNMAEGNETFSIVLSDPSTGAVLGPQTSHQVTITNATVVTLGFLTGELRVSENAASVFVSVHRFGPADSLQSVQYTITDGTAKAGTDFLGATSGTLSWIVSDGNPSLSIPLKRNAPVEGSETFYITLSNPTGGAVLGAHSILEVVINDRPAPPTSYYGLATSRTTGRQAHVIVTTSKLGAASAVARFGSRTVRFTGTLAFGTWQTSRYVDRAHNKSSTLTVAIDGPAERLTGSVTNPDTDLGDIDLYDFVLERAAAGSAAHPAPGLGYYTAVFGTEAPAPMRGTFNFRVTATGAAVLTGTLPDGRPLVQSTRIPDSGNLAVYCAPYVNQPGYLAGTVHLANQPLGATLQWDTRGARAGFQANPAPLLTLVGAPYHRLLGRLIDDFDTSNGAGTITIAGQSLANPFVTAFTLRPDNKAIILPGLPGRVLLSFNATTGAFNGSFLPSDGKRHIFRGVCVQRAGTPDLVQGLTLDLPGPGTVEIVAP